MVRKTSFWLHLSAGITAGVFIFIMAATGVVLSFERQIIEFIDWDIRFVSVPNNSQPRPVTELLEAVRRSGIGEPSAIVVRNQPQAATQLSIGRGKTVYVERLHRTLGSPLGFKTVGHGLAAISNLLFGVLIFLGIVLWMPRKWSWKAVRTSIAFRTGLRGRPREWELAQCPGDLVRTPTTGHRPYRSSHVVRLG
jgi:uncharacterized iron-regulated membrane protein